MNYQPDEYKGITYQMDRTGALYEIRGFDPDGHRVCYCKGYIAKSHLNGAKINALVLGALSTAPEYRRNGMARHCFAMMQTAVEENNCLISYLHPFSFNYYRTMGYERVSDHREVTFPIDTLSTLPCYPGLQEIRADDNVAQLDEVYNRFAATRNLMFERCDSKASKEYQRIAGYLRKGLPFMYDFYTNQYYLSRDSEGNCDGYIALHREMALFHHHEFGTLHINELCFTSPAALKKLLGFVRMFEGETANVTIHNYGMSPEIEWMLREYTATKINVIPDIAGKILDVPGVLRAVNYPKAAGKFTICVTDSPKSPFSGARVEGIWQVTYDGGVGSVCQLDDSAAYDIKLDITALTQIVHGFDTYGPEMASYLSGCQVINDCPDFFRAFPRRPSGVYELF